MEKLGYLGRQDFPFGFLEKSGRFLLLRIALFFLFSSIFFDCFKCWYFLFDDIKLAFKHIRLDDGTCGLALRLQTSTFSSTPSTFAEIMYIKLWTAFHGAGCYKGHARP